MALCVLSFDSHAQCPTPPDCPNNDAFSGPFTRLVPLVEFPGCTLKYEYCWREAKCYGQPYYRDLYIGTMQLIGNCEAAKADMAANMMKYIDKATVDAVNNANPWKAPKVPECCPPSTSPCWTEWTWRVGHHACYTEGYWNSEGIWTFDPCDVLNPKSCWDKVRFCAYVEETTNGSVLKLKIEKQPLISSTDCAEFGGPNGDLKCKVVCE